MLLFTSLHVCIIDIWAVGILPFLKSPSQGQMQTSLLYLQPCSVSTSYIYKYTIEHINLLKPLLLTTSIAPTVLPVMWCQISQGMSDWVCGVGFTDTHTQAYVSHHRCSVEEHTAHGAILNSQASSVCIPCRTPFDCTCLHLSSSF